MAITGSDFGAVENHYIDLKYSNLVSLLAQQTASKLEACVTVQGGLRGVTVTAANQLGKFSTRLRTGRYEETHVVDIARDRRWFEPSLFDGAVLFDPYDEIRLEANPQDKVVQLIMARYHRDIDKVIMEAFFGTNKTGRKAEKTTVFDENMIVTGETDIIKALNAGQERLQSKDVDLEQEELFCVVPPAKETELKEAGVYISGDYQDGHVLAGKKLAPYAGINFVRYNGLTPDSNGKYKLPLFCKSGVSLGKWEDLKVKVSERNDISHDKQIYALYAIGATRLEEAKCAAIEI